MNLPSERLSGREADRLEHQFHMTSNSTKEVTFDLTPLPKGAEFSDIAGILSWIPGTGQGANSYRMILQVRSADGMVVEKRSVTVEIASAYHPPEKIAAPVWPLSSGNTDSEEVKAFRDLADRLVTGFEKQSAIDLRNKFLTVSRRFPTEARVDFVHALCRLKMGGLQGTAYDEVLQSLSGAATKTPKGWIPSGQYTIWVLAVINRDSECLDAMTGFVQTLADAPAIAPISDMEERIYWLGQIAEFLAWRFTSEESQSRLDAVAADVSGKLPDNFQHAFRAGQHVMRYRLQSDSDAVEDKNREASVSRIESQQNLHDERRKIQDEIAALRNQFNVITAQFERNREPIVQAMSPIEFELRQVQVDLDRANARLDGLKAKAQQENLAMQAAQQDSLIAEQNMDATAGQAAQARISALQRDMNSTVVQGRTAEVEVESHKRRGNQLLARLAPHQKKLNGLISAFKGEEANFSQSFARLETKRVQLDRQISRGTRRSGTNRAFSPSLLKYLPIDFEREHSYVIQSCGWPVENP